MSAPDHQLAPSRLPRQQRRYVDRQLIRPSVCLVCGSPLKHNTRMAGGDRPRPVRYGYTTRGYATGSAGTLRSNRKI